ncbi:hypothetical protein OKW21_001441 [Catalinimonas alkaloidigena]|nr:hypothetical protein [Catalinimonas alkaloidigena]
MLTKEEPKNDILSLFSTPNLVYSQVRRRRHEQTFEQVY